MQKIGEIKSEIQAAEPGEYAALFEKYKEDTRSGVRKLLEQLHKKEEAYQKELLRTEKMRNLSANTKIWAMCAELMKLEEARWQVLL